ncbi:LAME_0F02476g1_1 [Lachancea meyersii CBS 8951]|uniref:Endoplasmic reticulum lectin n=1 Tax=Lachancea meyersii CBS 8951 TaxID=1266667 RepID=A0A1G4JQL0_9SACH|nr:LAME_0F02476g1_1 [Lachancea meyersii CBS 8951]
MLNFSILMLIATLMIQTAFSYDFAVESFLLPKYSIEYVDHRVFEQTVLKNESILESGSFVSCGKYTTCFKPYLEAETVSIGSLELKDQGQKEFEQSALLIERELAGRCLLLNSGFWSFRFCYGQNVTQFSVNQTSKTVDLHYLLGTFDAGHNESLGLSHDIRGFYVSQKGFKGDFCANIGTNRWVEVKYICDPTVQEARVVKVKEIKMCRYIVVVAVPGICQLELFSAGERINSAHPILCSRQTESDSSGRLDRPRISSLQPFFLGHNFYYLEDRTHRHDDSHIASKLLFTGEIAFSDASSDLHPTENAFLKKAVYAFQEMTSKGLLTAPDGSPFMDGDSMTWVSEVVDLEGQTLCILEVVVDANSEANLSFHEIKSQSPPVTKNIIQYTKGVPEDPALTSNTSTAQNGSPKRDMAFDISVNGKSDSEGLRKKLAQNIHENLEAILDERIDVTVAEAKMIVLEDEELDDEFSLEVEEEANSDVTPVVEPPLPVDQEGLEEAHTGIEHDEL